MKPQPFASRRRAISPFSAPMKIVGRPAAAMPVEFTWQTFHRRVEAYQMDIPNAQSFT